MIRCEYCGVTQDFDGCCKKCGAPLHYYAEKIVEKLREPSADVMGGNVFIGYSAGCVVTTGHLNTFVGRPCMDKE